MTMATTQLPTTLPTSSNNEDSTGVIVIAVAVSVIILVIGAIAFRLWWIRRKTGDWPKIITRFRRRRSPIHLNPYGKSHYGIHNNNNPSHIITPHVTDFRSPINVAERKVYSVSGGDLGDIEDSKVSDTFLPDRNKNLSGNVQSSPNESKVVVPDKTRVSISKQKESRDCVDIGMYPDRTLPATLMMTSAAKKQLFFSEDTKRRRSNSATLTRDQAQKLSSKNRNLQKFNDFAGQSDIGRYRPKKQNQAPLTSSRLSSKPSNTSDYVSDFDTGSDRRNFRKVGKRRTNDREKRDSAIHECLTMSGVTSQLPANRKSRNQQRVTRREPSFKHNLAFDDRTESQYNTCRISVKLNDDEILEAQSSDTESMVGRKIRNSFKTKRSQYDSDGDLINPQSRSKKRRRKCTRSRSEGWHSEPEFADVSQKTSRLKTRQQHRRRSSSSNSFAEKQSRVTYSKSTEQLDVNCVQMSHKRNNSYTKSREQRPSKIRGASYESASLKSPIGGMVIEMPIYSQSTWAGPGSSFTHKKKANQAKNRGKRTGRKLSIGGGGKYVMEYDTLPVDLSKLPKGLVEKIGGHPDQLLEPIEQLNFEELCRPMPSVLEPDGKQSARRFVIEDLPLNHCDREILANTYQYENTGLVTTDL